MAPASPTSPARAAARSTAVAPPRAARRRATRPCIRASNLANGRAFEFSANGGTEVGSITSGNVNAAPFTTNAKGVATGLNADQVDGKGAEDIAKAAHDDALTTAQGLTSFAAVAADGTLGGKRGASTSATTGTGTYTVAFANDISACAIQVTESTVTTAGAAAAELTADKKTVNVSTRDDDGRAGRQAVPHHGQLLAPIR